MEQKQTRFVTKYDCYLPLSFLSLLLKNIQSLSGFERFLHKKPITMLLDGYTSEFSKPQCELLWKGLHDLELTIEQMVETNYFIQIKFALLNKHPYVTKFNFIINLHYMSLNRTLIICELVFKQKCNEQLRKTSCVANKIYLDTHTNLNLQMHMVNPDLSKKNDLKIHQSTVLIGCSFSIIKKILMNFKLFNQLVPELCTRVETSFSDDIKEGDEIRLIYDIPKKSSLNVTLKATSVINLEEELTITLKTKDFGSSNTPSQQIEWIANRISSYELKIILRHSFDAVIQDEFIECLSKEKKNILNKLKNVLEMMENNNERK